MMKNKLFSQNKKTMMTGVIVSLLIALAILVFTSCSGTDPDLNLATNPTNGSDSGTEHVHEFSVQNTNVGYLMTEATCEAPAVYYYSCSCGEKDSNTFEHGSVDASNHGNKTKLIYSELNDAQHVEKTVCEGCNDTINSKTVSHALDPFKCSFCGYKAQELEAGLYENGSNYTVLLKTWDELVQERYITLSTTGKSIVLDPDQKAMYGELVISDSVTVIDAFALAGNGISKVYIPDSVKRIGEGAFATCVNLTEVTLPNGVRELGAMAFYDCWSLKTVRLPEGVSEISFFMFGNCKELASVTIPGNVTQLWNVFYKCESLTDITFLGTQEQWNAMIRDPDWDYDTAEYTVHCTDGDIAKA